MKPQYASKLLASTPEIEVGRYSYSAGHLRVVSFPSGSVLRIGSFCSIADGVTVLLGGNHNTEAVTAYPLNVIWDEDGLPSHETSRGDVVIGHDVWIGYGAMILSGIHIGNGAVIGAGSVVSHDVASYEIVAGNPVQHVRWRFDPATRAMVEELRWWNWPIKQIRERAQGLMSDASMFEAEVPS